jgi:hypothetical protein
MLFCRVNAQQQFLSLFLVANVKSFDVIGVFTHPYLAQTDQDSLRVVYGRVLTSKVLTLWTDFT